MEEEEGGLLQKTGCRTCNAYKNCEAKATRRRTQILEDDSFKIIMPSHIVRLSWRNEQIMTKSKIKYYLL